MAGSDPARARQLMNPFSQQRLEVEKERRRAGKKWGVVEAAGERSTVGVPLPAFGAELQVGGGSGDDWKGG